MSSFYSTWGCYFFILLVSLAIGSFLNVVVYRLPKMIKAALLRDKQISLWRPSSFCPLCHNRIRWSDNIPLISFLILKGHCRNCHQRINLSYFLVELITAVLSSIIFWHFGMNWQMAAALIFTWWLIPLAIIDWQQLILPDELTLSLLWLGLLINLYAVFTSLPNAVLGAAAGYVVFWVINKIYYWIRNKEGIGQGDWKLFAAFGAWFGWNNLLYILLIGALLGTIYSVLLVLLKRANKDTPIPFGCFLIVAAWIKIFLVL